MKCPNCKLEVSEGTKICPNCNYDFVNSSYQYIEFKKLNLVNKVKRIIKGTVVICIISIPSLYLFYKETSRLTKRNEIISELYSFPDDVECTFEEIKQVYPNEINDFEDFYEAFILEIKDYSPKGHEVNRFISHNGRLLMAIYDATITYKDVEIEVAYSDATPRSKSYSYYDSYNIECQVDQQKLQAFCDYTNLPSDFLKRQLINFMENIKTTSTLPEIVNLENGCLRFHYGENGKISISYEIEFE